jgi:5'-nucleotidase
MDGVLVDVDSAILRRRGYANDLLDVEVVQEYTDKLAEAPGIFSVMEPMPDAIESFRILVDRFDTYILSTSTCENHADVGDRLQWIKKYLGEPICHRLILTHHKHLNIGDYLIDNYPDNKVDRFIGEHIHFGSEKFPDWQSVLKYLLKS